jgi:GR25 family glycosyltransferase involved in LPS biosynthesis
MMPSDGRTNDKHAVIPVVVISLKSATARRQSVAERLDGIDYQFFDAIDGGTLSASERDDLAPPEALIFDRPLTAGEIGCAASHRAVIRQLAGPMSDHEFVCVLEDDAAPICGADLRRFLDSDLIRSLPPFDVLRMVSDPARWKRPAWPVHRTLNGHAIYAMARPGLGLQGQIYSRAGLRKLNRHFGTIAAPADFALYHDCHVKGLRVLEIRPGLLAHDELFRQPELQKLTSIGLRPAADRQTMSRGDRRRRRVLRQRRKRMAIDSFLDVWGMKGLVRVLRWWPPGGYFR